VGKSGRGWFTPHKSRRVSCYFSNEHRGSGNWHSRVESKKRNFCELMKRKHVFSCIDSLRNLWLQRHSGKRGGLRVTFPTSGGFDATAAQIARGVASISCRKKQIHHSQETLTSLSQESFTNRLLSPNSF
jgi:hypothetical protein